jgi:CheY-like chemotaxis protein
MDGYQICKILKAYPATKDVPVVMLSGRDHLFDKNPRQSGGCSRVSYQTSLAARIVESGEELLQSAATKITG